jgi:hypothetical protein
VTIPLTTSHFDPGKQRFFFPLQSDASLLTRVHLTPSPLKPFGHATQVTFPSLVARHIDFSKHGFVASLRQTFCRSTDTLSGRWTHVCPSPVILDGHGPQTNSVSPSGKHSTPLKQGFLVAQASMFWQSMPSPVSWSGQGPHSKEFLKDREQATPKNETKYLNFDGS